MDKQAEQQEIDRQTNEKIHTDLVRVINTTDITLQEKYRRRGRQADRKTHRR